MNKYILLLLMVLFILSGCSNNNTNTETNLYNQSNNTVNNTDYQSDYYQDEETQKECIEPENPYDDGSGHYAGYERGLEGKNCSGNSNSFIEGCEEYNSQEEDYENCTNS